MNIGERVRIEGTGTSFDTKEGILEEIKSDDEGNAIEGIVFVDFIPEENKKVRQNFPLESILPVTQENILGESKKSSRGQKIGVYDEPKYNLSSLNSLENAFGENNFKMLKHFPYKFDIYIANKFIINYNGLRKTLLRSDSQTQQFIKLFDRGFASLQDNGIFSNVQTSKVNGLANKYDGKIRELKICEMSNKPIRILYFLLPNKKMVLGNIFYHKSESLTDNERTSINSVYDQVVI